MPQKTITFSPTQDSITMNLNLMIDEFGTESSGSYLAPRADVEAIYKYRYGVILESISEESTMGNNDDDKAIKMKVNCTTMHTVQNNIHAQ